MFLEYFACRKFEGNIGAAVEQEEKLFIIKWKL